MGRILSVISTLLFIVIVFKVFNLDTSILYDAFTLVKSTVMQGYSMVEQHIDRKILVLIVAVIIISVIFGGRD